jgi:flavorubredoxin
VVAVAYVSAYGYTASLAAAVENGLKTGGIENVRMFDLVTDDMEEARAALQSADGILLGSPTLVGDALPPLYEVLIGLNPVIHRGKFGGAFGSYGWSGEAAKNLTARMAQLHFTLPLPEFRVRLKPSGDELEAARAFGQDFAAAMLAAK